MNLSTQNRGFTLIEMLVVIAIIALLAGILIPTLGKSITQTKKVKAQAACQDIEAAVKMYVNEYGQLPIRDVDHGRPDNPAIPYGGDPSNAYTKNLFRILLGLDGGFQTNFDLNPKQKTFLDIDDPTDDGTFLDPWGTQYQIIYDQNYDGAITYPAGVTHRKSVVAVSAGPDMILGNDDDIANVALEAP